MSRFAVTLPLLALLGCPTGGEVMCTDIAIASVIVNVTVEGDEEVDPIVEYSTDGETFTACDPLTPGEQYVCGYEIEGDLTVQAGGGEGYAVDEREVTVGRTEDGCHVVTETVDMVVTPMVD
ncbi:MAG: hypothetical protein ACK4YP_00470 [Myxococcota bacterium]